MSPGSQVLQDQLLKWTLGTERSEVDHHRQVRKFTRLDPAIYSDPFGTRIVRNLDTHHNVAIPFRDLGRSLRLHVFGVLLDIHPAAHAVSNDIQHGEHTSFGLVDDLVA